MDKKYRVTMSTHQFMLCDICINNTLYFLNNQEIKDFNFLDNWKEVQSRLKEIKPVLEDWKYAPTEFLLWSCLVSQDTEAHTMTLECTEKDLLDIAEEVESWHRFIAGQVDYLKCLEYCKDRHTLSELIKPLKRIVCPNLIGDTYGWSGGHCENKQQEKWIAETYYIYRTMLYHIHRNDDDWNTYKSPALTCNLSGNILIIEEL